MDSFEKSRRAFALVLSLFLMSFVLLLLVSITALLRVETAGAEGALARVEAREAARLALYMAIGQLQQHAGADQRVTARAEMVDTAGPALNPYWTGVWDTTQSNPTAHWLVSWPDQSQPPGSPSMHLLDAAQGALQAGNAVSAPAIRVRDARGRATSAIAWWTSDEGVKASAGLEDRSARIHPEFFTRYDPDGLSVDEQRQILRQLGPRRTRSEVFFGEDTPFSPGATEAITLAPVRERIQRAHDAMTKLSRPGGLDLIDGVRTEALRRHTHDLTLRAQSVLSDTARGGLKRDLSDRTFRTASGPLPINDQLDRFLWASGADANGDLRLQGLTTETIDAIETDSIVTNRPPIITECALYFAVSGERSNSRTARAFLRLEAEIWTPYGFRQAFHGEAGSESPELVIEIEGLPAMNLRFFDQDLGHFTNAAVLDMSRLTPRFELDLTGSHKAGEVRRVVADWPVNASSDPSNFYYTDDWAWEVADASVNTDHRRVSFPHGDSIRYTSEPTALRVFLRNQDGDLLQKVTEIRVGAIETDFSFYEDSPSSLAESDAPIMFYYRLRDDRSALESWLTTNDLRADTFDLSDPGVAGHIDLNDIDGDDRGDAQVPTLTAFSNLDRLHGVPNNNFFRIFDAPSTIPISLGVLQHAPIKDRAPFSIGNTWGASLNAVFDQYFVSGIPQDPNASFWSPELPQRENPLPNSYLRPWAGERGLNLTDLIGSESAEHLLISGSFNINSTSVRAWQAVLAGNYLYDWETVRNQGTSSESRDRRINLEGAFFRLPFSGHSRSEAFSNWQFPFELFEEETLADDDYPALGDQEKDRIFRNSNDYNPNQDWRPSLMIGHRENTLGELGHLATRIVDRLSDRNVPFRSLEEWINSGLIQQSIDATSINTTVDELDYLAAGEDQRIPRNAPAFLSQADIISALAPFISPRSDSFVIRAKGQSLHPMTGQPQSSATILARVQRVPERVDGNDAAVFDNADGLGRRFILRDFKWLSE